jgi:hypothetical protein
MGLLAAEAEKIREDDPRQAVQLMRRLTEVTGVSLGSAMEEALARLERGEDPEAIEAEMGELLEEEPFVVTDQTLKGTARRRERPPDVDDTLYELT